MIVDVDLSQIEWRVEACLTHDPVMIHEICNKIDQHAAACVDIMDLVLTKDHRNSAKIFNFRAIYANPDTAAFAYWMDNRMPNFTLKKWQRIMDAFYGKYHVMAETHLKWEDEVRRNGQMIGPTGRVWKFEKVLKKGVWDYSVTQIRNYPVQGTAGDVIKLALVYLRNRLKRFPNVLMVMTVHDSIIFDMPDEIVPEVARICIDTFNEIPHLMLKHFNWIMPVPIDGEADIGPSWAEVENII